MKPPLRSVLRNFLNHFEDYEARKKVCDDQYEYEFQQLKNLTDKLRDDPEYPCSCALKDVNRPKNRYKDIVPYDKSRVILPKCDGVPGSDYINASYVKGASGAFAYIAAQGPLPNTVIDFWRMVWICDVQVLVMACNEKEAGKSKCEAYWPSKGEVMNYGNISVELIETSQVCPDFLIRTLLVKCDKEMRDVYQFHYTTWPDHGVPESVQPILELVRLMRDCQATEIMPILVHCSAGCGRTGTICAVDYVWACLRQGKLDEDFSLFQIALELRRQRIAMIQTKEQYILAHKAVATLFEQQLNVIDCHIYVNVDEDGEPLMWKELSKNKLLQFKKSSTKESSPLKAVSNNKNEAKQTKVDDSNNKQNNSNSSFTDSSQDNSTTESSDKQSSLDNKLSSKMSLSDSLANSRKNSESSFSRNSYLSQQSNDDSIPFIDDDEVSVRPHCGRAYLNMPNCDSIMNHFDPFVDKVALDTDDSSPDADPNSFDQKLLDFHSKQLNAKEKNVDNENLKSEEADQINANIYSTLPSSSSKKKDYPVNNRESYPPSSMGLSRFHDDSISDLGGGSADSLKGSKKVGKANVVRRPSISKLKALFEKSFKSSNEGGKRPLFRNNSHSVSRAGSAPPSLNCMDKTADSERESILMMVTRKFRSASVRNEREISSKPYARSEHRRSSPGTFKEGIATLSRTVSFNLSKTFRGYLPSKAKVAKPAVVETGRVSIVEDSLASEPVKSKLPDVQPKGKSMWYDKSSLPRSVSVIKPAEKTFSNADVPKSPTEKHDSENPSFGFFINRPPKLLPFFSTLSKTNGRDNSTMWYSESDESNIPKESANVQSNPDSNTKLSYKSHSKVLPFIHSIAPWKKATSKSPLSSPDSPKSLVAMNLPLNTSTSNSKFYTEVRDPVKKPSITPPRKKAHNPPCPVPEEIIPLSTAVEKSVLKTDEPATSLNSSISSITNPSSSSQALDLHKCHEAPAELSNLNPTMGSNTNLSSSSEVVSIKPFEAPLENKIESVAKASKDTPPAIPKKIGKNKQIEKQPTPKQQEMIPEGNLPMNEEKSPQCKEISPLLVSKEEIESVPSSPKDLYINVNIKAKKNIEQIETTLRNNPRGAIIDLTSRESYCMEEELDNALKQLSKPDDSNNLSVNKGNSKFPGYEVIWPEANYPNGNRKVNPGIKHCKTGLCYSPPLRRSVTANIGLVKCRSCSNIDCLEPNDSASLGIPKDPLSTPNKQLFTDAVVELNTLLDRLTTRTLTEETDLEKKAANSKVQSKNSKENLGMHAVTLLSKSNAVDGSPPKEEEIIFHFPPPPPLPPPEEEPVSETFNIVRKNGSLVVSEKSKTKDMASGTSYSESNKTESVTPNSNSVPQPAPRKSKQVPGLRRSASYTNVFPQKAKGGYENVFLEKYQTLSRLKIDSTVGSQEANEEVTNSKLKEVKSKQQTKQTMSTYVNIDPLATKVDIAKQASATSKQVVTDSYKSNAYPPPSFIVDKSSKNLHSNYGKLIKISDRLHISEDKPMDPQSISAENMDNRKKPSPSKKSERAPLPPEFPHSFQTKDNIKDFQKPGVAKKFPSRKSEKAPLPPPLLQKSASAINAAKNRPNYVNFPSRSHTDDTKVLPALHENIANNNSMSKSAVGILVGNQRDIKTNSNFAGRGLSHSQSDASVFKALKDRKSQSLGRGLDPKRHVINTILQQNKELASVSSSDSDSSYERIFFDKVKEQPEREISKCSVKEQITALNSTKSFKKDLPVAPPRSRRRNTTEINYAKVKSKEESPSSTTSATIQESEKCFERRLHIPESPPAIPLKTKDAFEVPGEIGAKGSRQRTAAWVQQSDPNFKR